MAANPKRRPAPSFMTPRGTLVYPKLNEPDTKFKADGEYSVKLRFSTNDPAVQALIAKLQPLYDEAQASGAVRFNELPIKSRKEFAAKNITGPVMNPMFSVIYDETTEEPTGDIEFKFATAAKGVFKTGKNVGQTYYNRPDIFDARGVMLVKGRFLHIPADPLDIPGLTAKAGPPIWSGSEGKVNFEVGLSNDVAGYFVPSSAACGLSLRLRAVQIIKIVSGGERDAAAYGFGVEEGYEGGAADAGEPVSDAAPPGDASDYSGGGSDF